MKKWVVGVYLRLSFDEKGEEESNSVGNQRKLIDYYLLGKKDLTVYKYYVDDGYTGTDFNRPGYKSLLNDIKNKKINGIIIKDLSRLGRNYILVGDFLDEIVPTYNLRFISVNDNVDNYINRDSMDSLEIPFKNLMNENYSRDSSKKMRSSLKASKKSGNFIGKYAPFGYLKNDDDCHKFIIDDEAAKIIKQIFKLALSGLSKQEIIKELKNKNIPTPSVYLNQKYNLKLVRISKVWNTDMIDMILKNENYVGNSVQGKRKRISHKTHNMVRIAEDDWIIYNNHHKAIIDEKIFNQVQDVMYNRNNRINNKGNYNKYCGFLRCSECGSNLYRFTTKKKSGTVPFYYCGTYVKTKKCNKHFIQEKELDEVVLATINKYIELICDVGKKIDDVVYYTKVEYNKEIKQIRQKEIEKEAAKYKKLLDDLVKDYQCDYINQDDYENFKEKYLFELNKLNIEKEDLNNNINNSYNLDWINEFKKTGQVENIDRNIINSFIENIFVGDNKEIEIKFRYKDQYEDALRYLKNQNNMI
ncbi:MAG: recombinase family protein [Bacilli bacterium]|nr:recombinase family protein [Bacilli bacterium]